MSNWYIILTNNVEFINLTKEAYTILLDAFKHLISSHGRSSFDD